MRPPYDVIIAGASFAGLAVARQLRGRVLLLDRQPIGEGVTSACAAPVRTVAVMGASPSILETHDEIVIHTPGGSARWPLPEPFCTFDYRRFCREAAVGIGAQFRLASVQGHQGHIVTTSAGDIAGRYLVDATGPRAALAGRSRPRYAAFGLESEVPHPVAPGLHFYFVPEVRDGYAWAFPCGGGTRFGVLSYRGRTQLLPALRRFMQPFGVRPGDVHGGFLATGWPAGVRDGVFTVGDAAGQCLPFSGEGIRTAVLAGIRCGWLLQRVLDGAVSPSQAEHAYRAFVATERRRYRGLLAANLVLLALPQRWLRHAAARLSRPAARRWFFTHYLGIFDRPDHTGNLAAPHRVPLGSK
jgi:flavin-dependent dehydrogenase